MLFASFASFYVWIVKIVLLDGILFYTHTNIRTQIRNGNFLHRKRTSGEQFYEERINVSGMVCTFFSLYLSLIAFRKSKCVLFLFMTLHSFDDLLLGEMSRRAANMMETYSRLNFMWHLKCSCLNCVMHFFCLHRCKNWLLECQTVKWNASHWEKKQPQNICHIECNVSRFDGHT